MKPRVGVYLSEGTAARLAEAAKSPRVTKSALVEAALDRDSHCLRMISVHAGITRSPHVLTADFLLFIFLLQSERVSLLVRVGSKTEVPGLARHVRFTLRSRHRQPAPACPSGATRRHGPHSITSSARAKTARGSSMPQLLVTHVLVLR